MTVSVYIRIGATIAAKLRRRIEARSTSREDDYAAGAEPERAHGAVRAGCTQEWPMRRVKPGMGAVRGRGRQGAHGPRGGADAGDPIVIPEVGSHEGGASTRQPPDGVRAAR
ncbi:unnamed protein product [Calypogeia fissa]